MRRVIWFSWVAAALCFGAAQQPGAVPEPEVAAIRVANLTGGAAGVRLLVGGAVAFANVPPGVVSGYRTIIAGEQDVRAVQPPDEDETQDREPVGLKQGPVTDADRRADDDTERGDRVDPGALAFAPGQYYTFIVTDAGGPALDGTEGDPEGEDDAGFRTHLLADDLGPFPPAGWASVRVVNVATGVTALNVQVVTDGADGPDESGAASGDDGTSGRATVELGESVAFGQTGGYVEIAPGRYQVWFRPVDAGALLQALSDVQWRQGTMYSLYIFGPPDAEQRSVVMAVDALVRDRPPGSDERSARYR